MRSAGRTTREVPSLEAGQSAKPSHHPRYHGHRRRRAGKLRGRWML